MQVIREPYCDGLDLLSATPSRPPRAVILFFHGGAWIMGAPEDAVALWPPILKDGILCASAAYPLGDIYTAISAAKAARDYVKERFPDVPLVLSGWSAGATLALLAGINGGADGLALVNPVLDLSASGFKCSAIPQAGDETISPTHILGAATFPPTIIFQGDKDTVAPYRTALRFVVTAKAHRLPVDLRLFPDGDHMFWCTDPGLTRIVQEIGLFAERAVKNTPEARRPWWHLRAYFRSAGVVP